MYVNSFRSDRKKWAFGLFLGCTALYSCRTVTPLCVAVMAKEFDWDKTQSVSFGITCSYNYNETNITVILHSLQNIDK